MMHTRITTVLLAATIRLTPSEHPKHLLEMSLSTYPSDASDALPGSLLRLRGQSGYQYSLRPYVRDSFQYPCYMQV